MTFNFAFAWSIMPQLFKAAQVTLLMTVLSFGIALIGGLPILYLRLSRNIYVSRATTWVADFIRGTPLLVQIFFIYYVGPSWGLTLGPFATGLVAIGLHYSCYMAETYRAAYQTIGGGQWEAAQALGLNRVRTFQKVVLPQMYPLVVPIAGSYLVYMFKDTPVLAAITVREMMQVSSQIGADNFRYMEPLTLVGLLFLTMSLAAAWATRILERRVALH